MAPSAKDLKFLRHSFCRFPQKPSQGYATVARLRSQPQQFVSVA